MKQDNSAPTTKVIAGGVAGALATIAVWALQTFGKVAVPPEIAVALSTILSFAVGYMTPPGEGDGISEK
jgi:uncharacterized membrane-anchored protein